MFNFVNVDAENIGIKRRQPQRACERCRKRKKRCDHGFESLQGTTNVSTAAESPLIQSLPKITARNYVNFSENRADDGFEDASSSPEYQDQRVLKRSSKHYLQAPSSSRHLDGHADNIAQDGDRTDSQFIGDLNPEVVFLENSNTLATRGNPSSPLSSKIGTWIPKKPQLSKSIDLEQVSTNILYGSSLRIHRTVLPELQAESLACLPSAKSLEVFCSAYFEKYHPLLPIVDHSFLQSVTSDDPARVLLLQGICLVASSDPEVKDNLQLIGEEILLTVQDFRKRLMTAMRISIEIGQVTSKTILIQALALMSMCASDPDSGDFSSHLCGRAVQHLHSLGLHIQKQVSHPKDEHLERLLCGVWVIDRLHAAFYGRPVLMHERDMGKNLQCCIQKQQLPFQLLLQVVVLLDSVIELYRPASTLNESDLQVRFLPFEELITECAASNVSSSLLATIETLYHAAAILSCRSAVRDGAQGSSPSQVRQALSAERVTSIVGHEYCDQVVLLPFVPYAVSLSLSVGYRQMRHSTVPMYRARARAQVEANCDILEKLAGVSGSAARIVDKSKTTLREMDRVYSTMMGSQRRTSQRNSRRGSGSVIANEAHENVTTADVNTGSNLYGRMQEDGFNAFSQVPEIDIFGAFDPNFDLAGIDAYLEGNLDLALPLDNVDYY